MTDHKNAALLTELGFVEDTTRSNVFVLAHPTIPKVKLVSFSDRRAPSADFFTEFGSSPLNTPGDKLNICIRVQNHDEVFAETIIRSVVGHFLSLSA